MIDLYTWSTPNGRKVSIMLEECGLDYAAHPIDITKDEQFKPDFLEISPNNRIPAIVDRDNGRSLFESGAILLYLADKTGKFMPKDPDGYWVAMQWLMWQMGGVGPMIGQVHDFLRNAKGKAPYAEERYSKEAHRLYRRARQAARRGGVSGRRIFHRRHGHLALDLYGFEWHQVDIAKYANVLRWYKAIAARPAVVKGYHVLVKQPGIPMPA